MLGFLFVTLVPLFHCVFYRRWLDWSRLVLLHFANFWFLPGFLRLGIGVHIGLR